MNIYNLCYSSEHTGKNGCGERESAQVKKIIFSSQNAIIVDFSSIMMNRRRMHRRLVEFITFGTRGNVRNGVSEESTTARCCS